MVTPLLLQRNKKILLTKFRYIRLDSEAGFRDVHEFARFGSTLRTQWSFSGGWIKCHFVIVRFSI